MDPGWALPSDMGQGCGGQPPVMAGTWPWIRVVHDLPVGQFVARTMYPRPALT